MSQEEINKRSGKRVRDEYVDGTREYLRVWIREENQWG